MRGAGSGCIHKNIDLLIATWGPSPNPNWRHEFLCCSGHRTDSTCWILASVDGWKAGSRAAEIITPMSGATCGDWWYLTTPLTVAQLISGFQLLCFLKQVIPCTHRARAASTVSVNRHLIFTSLDGEIFLELIFFNSRCKPNSLGALYWACLIKYAHNALPHRIVP